MSPITVSPTMLSQQQFDRARRLALSLAGIELVERHRELVDHRSRRLGVLAGGGIEPLLAAAEKGETTATQQFLRLVTTKCTGFFRHPRHFDVVAEHALEAARQRDRACVWSAGVATGEEPYSVAMSLIEVFRRDDPPASILATDLDLDALVVARRGEYGEAALPGLEPARRERFLMRTSPAQRWEVTPAVRRLVEFRELNLVSLAWPVEGPFDVILCRNVLMYLGACYRYAVLERMASLLALDGLLIVDPTEHLGQAGHLFGAGADGVYPRQRTLRLERGC